MNPVTARRRAKGGDYMVRIRVIHDQAGGTLTVWSGDPATEAICEETADEVVLMKDAAGNVIGCGVGVRY